MLPPCTYQGGKQRISNEIITYIDKQENLFSSPVMFYDMCCGSGAITLELTQKGFPVSLVRMCDISPWGEFWESIGNGTFDTDVFSKMVTTVPEDKRHIKQFMENLSQTNAEELTIYRYLLLQAASFGGKQVWRDGPQWKHNSFRNYWMPTETSVRKSPVNPIQPQPKELFRRVENIANACVGVSCFHEDVVDVIKKIPAKNSCIVYIDPPYPGTTHYGYNLDIMEQVQKLLGKNISPIYVSMDKPLSKEAVRLNFDGPKGGISGNKVSKGQEWLSTFRA